MNNLQLDFAFVAELPTAPVAPKKRATRAKPAPLRAPGLAPTTSLLEQLPVVAATVATTGSCSSSEVDRATGLPVGAVQVYDGLEDPGMPIPPEVQEITGITPDMVQGQRLDEDRIAALLEGVDLVIAHNAGFDRPFCEARIARFKELSWACSFAEINWKEQGRSSAKLESLALELGWFYDAHRAEMDCHALLAVLAATLPRASHTGMAQVLLQSSKPSYRLQATNAPFDAKDKLKARGYRWGAEQRVWHTRVGDPKALQAEFEWLKENAYNQRAVVVQFEKLDARVRYSSRPVETLYHQL